MQNGIASAKKITGYDEENIWHSDLRFNRTENASPRQWASMGS